MTPKGTALKMKIAGPTTPTMVSRAIKPKASIPTTPRIKAPASTGNSPQAAQYSKAMQSAIKNTKTFGVPGAK